MGITAAEFDYVRELVRGDAAIVLDDGKEYLVETRLQMLARRENVADVSLLIAALRKSPNGPLRDKVIDAMTTNETLFFRDLHPFETLKKEVLPEIIAARESVRRLNIWCGACSSGQEPYSIAMILKENFPALASWRVRIVCTDISEEMLERTKTGLFSQLEVNRGMPAPLLIKYFEQQGTKWQIKDELRRMLEVKSLNLAAPWPTLGEMDLVFIRNVLIYFDADTKKDILGRIRNVLSKDGYLFLGSTETTLNLDPNYELKQFGKTTCYRRV